MRYRVFDDKHASETTVFVKVTDVNDNAPKFTFSVYNYSKVVEEDQSVLTNPKYLLTVSFVQIIIWCIVA